MPGLSLTNVVSVGIIVAPNAAPRRNFGRALIAGNTAVIDVSERMRLFSSEELPDIATLWGTTAPEYLAAKDWFAQQPTPNYIYIGRWARTASAAILHGGALTPTQQALANFTAITSGGFAITIDGSVRTLATINLSGATNLNGVAAIIDTALSTWGDCIWNAYENRFEITSSTTGAGSTIAAVTTTALSTALGITPAAGASIVNGIAAETPVAVTAIFADMSSDWYNLEFADTNVTNDQHIAVMGFIEALVPSRTYGSTTLEAGAISAASTTDLAYRAKAGNFSRSAVQYSSLNPYAVASLFSRIMTTDFNANNTTITLFGKNEPGVQTETLTQAQASALKVKKGNVFVKYENDTAIIQYGTMANGRFIDEVYGLDAFANYLQTELYNCLYQTATKIPQTDAGMTILAAAAEKVCSQFVTNGFIAPGIWTAQGFGKLKMNDFLSAGYYVYMQPLAQQSQSDREARRATSMQIAIKLASAVHEVNAIVNVNR